MINRVYYANRVELVDEYGRRWREAEPAELADCHPETLVCFGRGDPQPAGVYAEYRLPGGYPFLAGICRLVPVYILATKPVAESVGQ